MTTRELINALRGLYVAIDYAKYIEPGLNFETLSKAADRLEELEDQLSEKQEWISVEDERKPKHLQKCFVAYCFGDNDLHFFGEATYIVNEGNGIVNGAHFNNEGVAGMRVTHWMEIPKLPKPKEPTFKDVFLEAFPKTKLLDGGTPVVCAKGVFPQIGDFDDCCNGICRECWNQPYFGTEEEGEAE